MHFPPSFGLATCCAKSYILVTLLLPISVMIVMGCRVGIDPDRLRSRTHMHLNNPHML